MEEYVVKEGKRLRLGYTTGSCAAAAAKGAARMLLTGEALERVCLMTPKGLLLELGLEEITREPDRVRCAVRKDSGDDPDITRGTLVFAEVTRKSAPGITIDGGTGVGRVTKPGLDQPVGNAAINSVPRRMIEENLREVLEEAGVCTGLHVVISVPEGEALAKKTFNPRLGIVGGISILGTTGIVEPMSEQALVDTIRVELRQRRESGAAYVLLTPGNYGSEFIRDGLGLDPGRAVQVSNYIGDAIDLCRELGFRGAVLIGHIGKLVKIAGNMLNTHSKFGDCRMPILGAMAGAEGLPPEGIRELLGCVSCDEGIRILETYGRREQTMARLMGAIHDNLQYRAGSLEMGCAMFSKEYGMLGITENAKALTERILEGT